MQDFREFQELESMGETFQEEIPPQEVKTSGGAGFLLFQAAVCLLLLIGLVCLKLSDGERYRQVRGWYQQEIEREIELPRWEHQQEDVAASLFEI